MITRSAPSRSSSRAARAATAGAHRVYASQSSTVATVRFPKYPSSRIRVSRHAAQPTGRSESRTMNPDGAALVERIELFEHRAVPSHGEGVIVLDPLDAQAACNPEDRLCPQTKEACAEPCEPGCPRGGGASAQTPARPERRQLREDAVRPREPEQERHDVNPPAGGREQARQRTRRIANPDDERQRPALLGVLQHQHADHAEPPRGRLRRSAPGSSRRAPLCRRPRPVVSSAETRRARPARNRPRRTSST